MARSPKPKTFKYVTIEQDDSELVIVAGSHDPGLSVESRRNVDTPTQSQNRAVKKVEPADRGAKPSAEKSSEKEADTYRETTLDDLDHEPMSKMQRAVLLGIAVLVVVFVVYVLFF